MPIIPPQQQDNLLREVDQLIQTLDVRFPEPAYLNSSDEPIDLGYSVSQLRNNLCQLREAIERERHTLGIAIRKVENLKQEFNDLIELQQPENTAVFNSTIARGSLAHTNDNTLRDSRGRRRALFDLRGSEGFWTMQRQLRGEQALPPADERDLTSLDRSEASSTSSCDEDGELSSISSSHSDTTDSSGLMPLAGRLNQLFEEREDEAGSENSGLSSLPSFHSI